MSRDEYAALINSDAYVAFSQLEGFEHGEPYERSQSLLVYRAEALDETLQLDAEKVMIVFESRYALDELEANATLDARSVLLDEHGSIQHHTRNTLGFRVAYISPDGDGDADERTATYEPGDTLVAPVTNAWVSNGPSVDGQFVTDDEGRYQSHYLIPPCPGFTYHYSIPHFAAVPYRSFNPQRAGSLNHYLFSSLSGYTCSGAPFYNPIPSLAGTLDYISAFEIYALNQPLPTPAHFAIDVTLISGRFTLSNTTDGAAIPLGDETRYALRINESVIAREDREGWLAEQDCSECCFYGRISNSPCTAYENRSSK